MHTLEKIASAMGKRYDEDAVHAALLLSFVQSAYGTVRAIAAPSPLYRLGYDEKSNHVGLEETEGSSHVPRAGTADISDLDILLISNLRDIPVLLEGETGVGKTFISQAYLRTILPQDSAISLRLSGSTFLNNIFQPFLEGRIEQGMPVTRIKQSAVDRIGALFVDEINRGDPQSILQLLDGELYNAGVFTKLGLPIPRLGSDGAYATSERRKKLLVVSAQNPAGTTDAKFTGTIELDAAVDNRLLKIHFGNAARSVGSTLWLSEEVHKPFEAFLAEFAVLASKHLGVDAKALDGLGGDWLSLYAWVADASRTDKPVLYSALELTDALTTVLGGDLPEKHEYELGIIRDWSAALSVKMPMAPTIGVTDRVKKVHDVAATFKVPVIFRDIVQIKKLADVLSTLGNLRDALTEPDPVAAYRSLDRFVSVREIAGATALLARSKQLPKAPSPTPLVNEVLLHYTSLTEKYLKDVGYMPETFDRADANLGIKKLAVAKAARETLRKSEGAAFLVNGIAQEAARLTKHQSATAEIGNILVAKTAADLLTLAGFISRNEAAVTALIKKRGKGATDADVVRDIAGHYLDLRKSLAPVMPDIFQHRLQRTLGV